MVVPSPQIARAPVRPGAFDDAYLLIDLSGKFVVLAQVMDVKLRTLPTQVAGVLVGRIVEGEFADGLAPSEQQIALEFSVSRADAREALNILQSLDMVDISQGRRVTL